MKKNMFNDSLRLTQAVLDGTKIMTRRIVSDATLRVAKSEVEILGSTLPEQIKEHSYYCYNETVAIAQSYNVIYDKLEQKCGKAKANEWWCDAFDAIGGNPAETKAYRNKMFVRADLMIHHIKITDVKVERLQDISDEDCLREGIRKCFDHYHHCYAYQYLTAGFLFDCPRETFSKLIDRVSGKGTWKRNPWVVAYSFERID